MIKIYDPYIKYKILCYVLKEKYMYRKILFYKIKISHLNKYKSGIILSYSIIEDSTWEINRNQ